MCFYGSCTLFLIVILCAFTGQVQYFTVILCAFIGSLHLGWWTGNQMIQGVAIPLTQNSVSLHASRGGHVGIQWLVSSATGTAFNHTDGLMVTGNFTANGKQTSVGFAFESGEKTSSTTVILMDLVMAGARGRTVVGDIGAAGAFQLRDVSGNFPCGNDGMLCNDATLVSISSDQLHSFILLVRRGMFELYVDDMLVQYYTYGAYPVASGKIGVAINGTVGSTAIFHGITVSAWSH